MLKYPKPLWILQYRHGTGLWKPYSQQQAKTIRLRLIKLPILIEVSEFSELSGHSELGELSGVCELSELSE